MKKRYDPNSEFDLFLPIMGDLPLKDQRETMERPFFSLQKRKRVKPIEYTSPDGATWVKIEAIPAYGMATIWDADIIIWATSTLNRMREQGINDLPRTLKTTSYDLLRAIKRDTSGRAYQERLCCKDRPRASEIRRFMAIKRPWPGVGLVIPWPRSGLMVQCRKLARQDAPRP